MPKDLFSRYRAILVCLIWPYSLLGSVTTFFRKSAQVEKQRISYLPLDEKTLGKSSISASQTKGVHTGYAPVPTYYSEISQIKAPFYFLIGLQILPLMELINTLILRECHLRSDLKNIMNHSIYNVNLIYIDDT